MMSYYLLLFNGRGIENGNNFFVWKMYFLLKLKTNSFYSEKWRDTKKLNFYLKMNTSLSVGPASFSAGTIWLRWTWNIVFLWRVFKIFIRNDWNAIAIYMDSCSIVRRVKLHFTSSFVGIAVDVTIWSNNYWTTSWHLPTTGNSIFVSHEGSVWYIRSRPIHLLLMILKQFYFFVTVL